MIDGSGAKWWGPAEEARRKKPGYTLPRPNLIVLTGCRNLRVENITIKNSPKFHLVPTDCDGVIISNVTITAPEHAANTDDIDPTVCRNVLITKCWIDVGDDNVAIKSGRKVEGREFGCENITVTDCTFLHGQRTSIGSETSGGVRNVQVRNCTFEGTENGIRIKLQRGKGGVVENVSYSDITMKDVDPADSGLDIDALRIVATGVNALRAPDRATIVVTHYQRLLNYIVPDFVHVLSNGRIVKSGGRELALELEEKGYGWLDESVESGVAVQ